jgi:hypothetical protein
LREGKTKGWREGKTGEWRGENMGVEKGRPDSEDRRTIERKEEEDCRQETGRRENGERG